MSEIITSEVAVERLYAANNILIICHKNPDGDTLGSAAALFWALKSLDKTAAVLCNDEIPAKFGYMKIEQFTGQFDPAFVVAVDVAGLQLFGDDVMEYAQNCDLCIDHHSSNSKYAKESLLNITAGANTEIIYQLLIDMNIKITPLMASCLYTGIATDTGCFKFSNTSAQSHIITAKLIDLNADHLTMNALLFESKTPQRLEIERIALQSLEYFYDGRCAVIVVTRDEIESTGVDNSDLDGLTAIPKMIEGVIVGITIRQLQTGSYKISVRTTADLNASAIASRLGGGGHNQAAGCEIIGSLDRAKTAILTEIEKELDIYKSSLDI